MLGKIVVSLVSLLLVVGVILGVILVIGESAHDEKEHQQDASASMKYVAAICEPTTYKDACARSIEPAAKNSSATAKDYIDAVVQATLVEMKKSLEVTEKTVVNKDSDNYNYLALEDCKQLLDKAIDTLQESLQVVDANMDTIEDKAHQLLSWMTATHSLQMICIDQIEKPELKSSLDNGLVNSTQLAHNAVHIFAQLSQILKLFNVQQNVKPSSRRLLQAAINKRDGFPTWFGAAERRLLARGGQQARPNAVVAKDGSGQFKTIGQAVAAYPKNHQGRYTIYVKAGVYDEQVIIEKKQPNIYIYGDGIGRTIVTGRKNYGKMKITTMNTATFATEGNGFIARAMTFRNEAGPEGHQAVAFRSQASQTAVFDCSFEGFQDTLYYQVNSQFYRSCWIFGTVDFIFGMGDAVIQESTIVVRKPMAKQVNTVTADGRTIGGEKASNGLVLQNCIIAPDKFLFNERFKFPTYLGRPWKKDALTVVMQSELGDFIRPEGYMIWQGESNHKTCEMYEFGNRGPGARTDGRSKDFSRFRVLKPQEAARYTPGPFLGGQTWIPGTGIPHKLGL
ncbi:hypothetical protein RD792_017921 [Penstemon davidsonii]|uniref:Pectinesterase n=1 Tax=Penstemon davidsonii TaxID=160366 RepID=A0ABR0DWZ6_9LAMI|nr:hypothetical protein RD792_017921 [Penstemon davidsonii]